MMKKNLILNNRLLLIKHLDNNSIKFKYIKYSSGYLILKLHMAKTLHSMWCSYVSFLKSQRLTQQSLLTFTSSTDYYLFFTPFPRERLATRLAKGQSLSRIAAMRHTSNSLGKCKSLCNGPLLSTNRFSNSCARRENDRSFLLQCGIKPINNFASGLKTLKY